VNLNKDPKIASLIFGFIYFYWANKKAPNDSKICNTIMVPNVLFCILSIVLFDKLFELRNFKNQDGVLFAKANHNKVK